VTDYAKFSFDEKFNPFDKEANIKRIYIEPSLSFEKGNRSSLTSFNAGRRETEYQTKLNPIDNSYNWAELSYRIYMEKKSKNEFHSLTPIFKYVYIDGENNYEKGIDSKLHNLNFDTLFKRNWYSGSDFFLEQNRLILGFEHNFYNASNGYERYFSLGRAFFRNKENILNNNRSKKSSIVTDFKANLSGYLKINTSLEFDSDLKKISRGSLGIVYEREEKKSIQLRSIYKRNPNNLNLTRGWADEGMPINQIELISQWELSSRFLVFGKVSRDYEKNYSRDLSYGIEYANCCLKLGLMKRKWLDQNYYPFFGINKEDINLTASSPFTERERDNIYLFFELTELGRFGKRISEVLSSKRFQ
jgi:lipopolysaccharide assembly outer membrane protein LptD (OstA)